MQGYLLELVGCIGTSPTEFEEWVDDLKITPIDAGPWLQGFGRGDLSFHFSSCRYRGSNVAFAQFIWVSGIGSFLTKAVPWTGFNLMNPSRPPSARSLNTFSRVVRTVLKSTSGIIVAPTAIVFGTESLTRDDCLCRFTGHSLGCAMASLAYSRAILFPEDFGPSVRVRDAYIFAAPVVCDVVSVQGKWTLQAVVVI